MSVYCPIMVNGKASGFIYIRRVIKDDNLGVDPTREYEYEIRVDGGDKSTTSTFFCHRYGDDAVSLVSEGLRAIESERPAALRGWAR